MRNTNTPARRNTTPITNRPARGSCGDWSRLSCRSRCRRASPAPVASWESSSRRKMFDDSRPSHGGRVSNGVTLREMLDALTAAAEAEERAGQFGRFEHLSVELGGAMSDADTATVQATEDARLFASDHLLTWRNILDS